jgi:D-arabinose 5-phosphate isomerase GutQ
MGAEFLVHAVVTALVEEVEILLTEQGDVVVYEAGRSFGALGHKLSRRAAAVTLTS